MLFLGVEAGVRPHCLDQTGQQALGEGVADDGQLIDIALGERREETRPLVIVGGQRRQNGEQRQRQQCGHCHSDLAQGGHRACFRFPG